MKSSRFCARCPSTRASIDHYENRPELLGPNLVANMEQARGYSFADAAFAQARQNRLYRDFLNFMEEFDILLSPTAAVPPFPVEQLYPTHISGEELRSYFHWLGLTYGITLTAHPAVTLPCGLDPTGAPFGLQVSGKRYGDRELLGVAAALERYIAGSLPARRRPRPNLIDLMA